MKKFIHTRFNRHELVVISCDNKTGAFFNELIVCFTCYGILYIIIINMHSFLSFKNSYSFQQKT